MLLRIGVLDSNGVSGMVDNDTMLMFLDLLLVEKKKKTKLSKIRDSLH